jgi:urea transport system ATP-binding protein
MSGEFDELRTRLETIAEELADHYLVMQRGEVIAGGPGDEMQAKGIRQLVAI